MAKTNPNFAETYSTNPRDEMVTMFRVTPRQLSDAGIEIRVDADGAIDFRSNIEPVQMFDPGFVANLQMREGDRESDRILDEAAHVVQRETFVNRLRRTLR